MFAPPACTVHSAQAAVVALHLLWQQCRLEACQSCGPSALSQPPQVGSCLQEYVTQLAMALLEQGRKPDNEGVTERIKRLVNEAVRASAAAQSAAAV